MIKIENLVRENIRNLMPYSSARSEYVGKASIWLDANENPYDIAYNRYPDPQQKELKEAVAKRNGLDANQVFVGNGSDEAIDLLIRAFCEPQEDCVYMFPPTYGMYEVTAGINNVPVVSMKLNKNFTLPLPSIIEKHTIKKGILFICSPNNPTGNVYALDMIKEIADKFYGIVAVDEAYIDFSDTASATKLLSSTTNLVILQTMSKALGSAGLRLGFAFASHELITILNKIKPPYNISTVNQEYGLKVFQNIEQVDQEIVQIKEQRRLLLSALEDLNCVKEVYPSEANFLLVKFFDADLVFQGLIKLGIVIRNRSKQLAQCLRITVGTAAQNKLLINALKDF